MPSIFIENDGRVFGLDSYLTEDLQLTCKKRVSHVEPVNCILRWVFHAIRCCVKDNSTAACFTRQWPCRWRVRLLNEPSRILGPFKTRQAAIFAEINFINNSFQQ